ncbi:hypothetical protein GCM10025866_10630 [Naasia aerilata]|uniref:Uncharacterized protein n=1 Tax=Naasia aerilata TaxID=1162966 RepID=A0ABM8GAB3_9MICO|nr:hypothetical protein GCM10025866_10630 [Naasia aerilata]
MPGDRDLRRLAGAVDEVSGVRVHLRRRQEGPHGDERGLFVHEVGIVEGSASVLGPAHMVLEHERSPCACGGGEGTRLGPRLLGEGHEERDDGARRALARVIALAEPVAADEGLPSGE